LIHAYLCDLLAPHVFQQYGYPLGKTPEEQQIKSR
jgi:hypothetical protein